MKTEEKIVTKKKQSLAAKVIAVLAVITLVLVIGVVVAAKIEPSANGQVENSEMSEETEKVIIEVVESITRESGSEYPVLTDFFKAEYEGMDFLAPLEETVNMNVPGEYEVKLLVGEETFTSKLTIVDTTSPVLVTKDAAIQAWETLTVEQLVESVTDLAKTEVAFSSTPDFTVVGKHEIPIVATDAYGNSTTVNAMVEVLPDTEAPVIEGVKNITATVGNSISYKKGITTSDNSGGKVTLKVDNSKVDTSTPGTYTVYYTATDESGNVAKAEAKVTMKEPVLPTEESMTPYLDKVIKSVTNSSMSKYDQAYALWNWCRKNISYSYSAGNRDTIWHGVYEGIYQRKGDCFAYYATYSALLTRCGIENIQVARINGTTNHWWNLVNVGDGWYHCDSSPRSTGDPYLCFMQTDAQIEEYTKNHTKKPNYYTFDKDLYPERETTIIFGD